MYTDRYASGTRWPAAWTRRYITMTGRFRRWFGGTPGGVPAAATLAWSAAELAAALRENSNLQLDWLWYATKMTSTAQRRVCLQRVL